MKTAHLTPRLLGAAEFVRRGAVFADVGTDHAYLPIFLLEGGKISRAICSDINEGPLRNAEKNAREHGLLEKIEFLLADGASALFGRGASDIAVCGMGGELIADIIEEAPHLKDTSIRLILQPMTKMAHLRTYLAKRGFKIKMEKYTVEGKRSYVTLLAEYSGEPYEISPLEAEIGYPPYDFKENPERLAYVRERVKALSKSVEGKLSGGKTDEREAELLSLIKNLLKGDSI